MTTRATLYLGTTDDPTPTLLEDAPDTFDWPEGACMAVTFTPQNCPWFGWRSHYGSQPSFTQFYGADGWPLKLPEERKRVLGDEMRREFQVSPTQWWNWCEQTWRAAQRDPRSFRAARAEVGLVRALVPLTSSLADSH